MKKSKPEYTIQDIITEWCTRLPYGYPTSPEHYELLYKVILEMTNIPPLQPRNPLPDYLENAEYVDFEELNVPRNVIEQIETIYEQLPDEERVEFDVNYRTHSIETFLQGGYQPFRKFFNILDLESSGGSMGRGEVQVLLAVRNSLSGGTGKHDILIGNAEWEVKEIGKSAKPKKSGELGKAPTEKTFRPGQLGFQRRGDVYSEINDFFVHVVEPIMRFEDAYFALTTMIDPAGYEKMSEFIDCINQYFSKHAENVHKKELSRKPWEDFYVGFKRLNEIVWGNDLADTIQDTRMTIQSADIEVSYCIDTADVSRIADAAGTETSIMLKIGQEIDSRNVDVINLLSKIKKSRYIYEPEELVNAFNLIKNKFFMKVQGLIVYDKNAPGIPISTTRYDWAICGLSAGQYTFALKSSMDEKYTFIHMQS
jgi:hypothetical protein